MTNVPSPRVSAAFILHALGGVLFFAYLLWSLLGSVGLFAHLSFLQGSLVQCAVGGAIFYCFSLPLLWQRPLATGWGIVYAITSLLFLMLVFTPDANYAARMMQREAGWTFYTNFHYPVAVYRAIFRLVLGIVFLLIQAAFLRQTLRAAVAPPAAAQV